MFNIEFRVRDEQNSLVSRALTGVVPYLQVNAFPSESSYSYIYKIKKVQAGALFSTINCPNMNLKLKLTLSTIIFCGYVYSQDSLAVDSVKTILSKRYEQLAAAMDERDLSKIVSFKTDDFHTIGPDGRVFDNIMMKEYSRQFITNNIPPYNIKNTILDLKVSENKIVAVADVLQEVIRKRDLAGKVREVRTSVVQTETWVYVNDQWKLKLVDNVHDQKRFVDGKRVDPAKPYDPNDPPYEPGKDK